MSAGMMIIRKLDADGDTIMPDFEQPSSVPGMNPGTAARLHGDWSVGKLLHEIECLREWSHWLNHSVKLAENELNSRRRRGDDSASLEELSRELAKDTEVRDALYDRRADLEEYCTWLRGEIWDRGVWEGLDGIE